MVRCWAGRQRSPEGGVLGWRDGIEDLQDRVNMLIPTIEGIDIEAAGKNLRYTQGLTSITQCPSLISVKKMIMASLGWTQEAYRAFQGC